MPTLVAQRGHVPRRRGATGTAGEQEVVTAIAAELNKYKPDGWKLVVIDADEPLERYKGDVFVALHCDGSTNTDAHGASVGYQTAAGSALAQKWKSEYVKQGWGRGFRPDNYTAGLRSYYGYKYAKQFTSAYMVVEHGFLTNKTDAAWIRSHYAECAKAVWMAVAGEVWKPKETAVEEYSWVLTHAKYTKARKVVKTCQDLHLAVGSRVTKLASYTDLKARMDVIAAMDDPAKRAAILAVIK